MRDIPELFLGKRNTVLGGVSKSGSVPGRRCLLFMANMARSRDLGSELLWLANVEADDRGPQSLGYFAFVLHQNKETKYL